MALYKMVELREADGDVFETARDIGEELSGSDYSVVEIHGDGFYIVYEDDE